MSPEAQRIAIAEACGWTEIIPHRWSGYYGKYQPLSTPSDERPGLYHGYVPDYLNSLDAVHEAICFQAWDADGMRRFENALHSVVAPHYTTTAPLYVWCMMHATAPQRCEALLKTLGLWQASTKEGA